jgi:beta-1,2-mannobiose phosphorylase / 1,2-beta-oligomannan phosphorylase
MKLKRYDRNPILSPLPDSPWESACTCNPTAWYDGKKVRLIYRAGPDNDIHPIYLGLAESTDGYSFRRVGNQPIFGPSENGFDAGCIEDPRIIKLGDVFFMTYATRLAPPGPYWKKTMPLNAYIPEYLRNGSAPAATRWNLTRGGLAVTQDFHKWLRLGPITDAAVDDRDVIIFPEQVGGRFAMLHRPGSWHGPEYGCAKPSIWLSFSNDLLSWSNNHLLAQPAYDWESNKIGGNAPPIRTPKGWLTLYHGVDDDFTYRVGAMMLDLNDPRKILGRTREPILEPEDACEREGLVKNVVFPCGNVVIGDTLFVYYGGADTHCCVATAPLAELADFVLSQPFKG